jgi:hypothetical protein
MAWEGALHFLPGLVAGQDLSAATAQFKFGYVESNGKVFLALTAGTRKALGIIQDTANLNGPVLLADGGISKCKAGIALSAGQPIMTDASAQGISAAVLSANHIQGYSLETVNSGELFACVIRYSGSYEA